MGASVLGSFSVRTRAAVVATGIACLVCLLDIRDDTFYVLSPVSSACVIDLVPIERVRGAPLG